MQLNSLDVRHLYDNTDSANRKVVIMSNIRHSNQDMNYYCSAKSDMSIRSIFTGGAAVIPPSLFHSICTNDQNPGETRDSLTLQKYPVCVRYVSANYVVVERPPFRVPVRMKYGHSMSRGARSDKISYENEIWIPWTVAIIDRNYLNSTNNGEFRSGSSRPVYMFFRSSALTSLDDVMVAPYTPNVYADGVICMGRTASDAFERIRQGELNPGSVTDIYNYWMNEYFSGGWNLDLVGHAQSEQYLKLLDSFIKIKEFVKDIDNSYLKRVLFPKYGESIFGDGKSLKFDNYIPDRVHVKLFINVLSHLSLGQTLSYVDSLASRSQALKARNITTLGKVLSSIDPSDHEVVNGYNRATMLEDIEHTYFSRMFAKATSAASNQLSSHTWAINIEYSVKDFRQFLKNRIASSSLDYYVTEKVREILDVASNEPVQWHLINEWNLKGLIRSYRDALFHKTSKKEALFEAINKSLIDIRNYYYENGASSSYKHVVEIDASACGLILYSDNAVKEVSA